MTQKRYAIAHHAKFGKLPLTAEMMEAIKVMSHASCQIHLSVLFSFNAVNLKRDREHTYAIDIVASANGSPTMFPSSLQQVLCFRFDQGVTKAEPP